MNRILPLLGVLFAVRSAKPTHEQVPSPASSAPASSPAASSAPVPLSLRVETAPAPGEWKLIVTNTSSVPVRFAADGRLLRLEIDNPNYVEPTERATKGRRSEPKPKPKTIACSLPAPMVPSHLSDDRALALPPGGRYEESFPPALFCFDNPERSLLASGARVTPIFGFAAPSRPNKKKGADESPGPPFVAEPLRSDGAYSPVKEVVGPSFTAAGSLDAPRPLPDPANTVAPDAGVPRLELSLPARIDALDPDHVDITVTLKNAGKRSALVRMRRDSMLFTVETPSGMVACGAVPNTRSIPADLLSQLSGGASESLTVRLAEHCPDNTFERPGLYRVWTKVVLPEAGAKLGQRALSGSLESADSALVRVQSGKYPYYAEHPSASVAAAATKMSSASR